jgi:hypothetical protein
MITSKWNTLYYEQKKTLTVARLLRGSPLLSALSDASFLCGSMVVALRCKLASRSDRAFHNPFVLFLVPADVFVLVVCTISLYPIHHIGTLKTAAISLVAWAARRGIFDFAIPAPGQ